MKIWKVVSNSISILLFVLLILMIFIVISTKASGGEPEVFGYQFKTVLSGSMEPTFQTGSIIVVKPVKMQKSFKADDIITFLQSDGTLVTHRITEIVHSGENVLYQTKGDANEDADINLVLSQNVVAKYTGYTIPYLGYFVNFAQSSKGTALLLIVPGILLLLYASVTIFSALKELDPKTNNNESA